MTNLSIAQIYVDNPVTSIGATDLMYIGQGGTTDGAIIGSAFNAIYSPLTTKGDLFTYSNANARLAVGGTNGQILQVLSSAGTGLAWSTATYPATASTSGNVITSGGTNFTSATLTSVMDVGLGSTQGDILYRNGTVWTVLAPGTAGYLLQSGGAAANPSWVAGGSGPFSTVGTHSATGGDGTDTIIGTLNLDFGSGNAIANSAVTSSVMFGQSLVIGSNCTYCFLGGNNSTIGNNSNYSFAWGDNISTSASYNFAFGNNITINHTGSAVWGDHSNSAAQDSANDQWVSTYAGGHFWNYRVAGTATLGLSLGTTGITTARNIVFSTTSGITGTTTNDSAAAGSVGQLISSVIAAASSVSLTTTTAADITSISLTAGDWDVWGNITFTGATGTTYTASYGWTSQTSATVPDASLYNSDYYGGSVLDANNVGFNVPELRISLSGTTTIYLSAVGYFGTNTLKACGGIYARRIR